MQNTTIAPGQRISLRSEDFIVTKAHTPSTEAYIVECEGTSELVRGQRFVFDLRIDSDFKVVKPENTQLVSDSSSGYLLTKLYLESKLRSAEVSSDRITIGHRAAINPADYQMKPSLMTLKRPFARILIADAVGLGKTIEVGILLAELMKRGRGRRILVLALKSILAQFQQEIWDRFAIPLKRLDSVGVAKLRAELPINKNPFEYYDKSIISIDTLKNNAKFRHYLEQTHWDVIVIDECHNVANADSLRGGLAKLLSTRCDNLILTSATPHNGKAENFANLMRLLDPMIVPLEGAYALTGEHIEKVVVRRTKQHLPDDVSENFSERKVIPEKALLYPAEEAWLAWQQNLKQSEIAAQTKNGKPIRIEGLFGITLFKAYLSSPAAADETIKNRLAKNALQLSEGKTDNGRVLAKVPPYGEDPRAAHGTDPFDSSATPDALRVTDVESESNSLAYGLELLQDVLNLGGQDDSTPNDSKLEAFFALLDSLKWKGKEGDEFIVVFAERKATLEYLEEQVARRYKLVAYKPAKDAKVPKRPYEGLAGFSGSLSDTEQTALIEDFGSGDSPIRLLLCSDAGSQGVNLHYQCNRMVNYDLPWSLITLDQRNGRIDRYGQTKTPFIHYIIAKSENDTVQADLRIVERIKEKEEVVNKTLGDASSVTEMFDVKKEERATAEAIAKKEEDYLPDTPAKPIDPIAAFMQQGTSEKTANEGKDDGLDYEPQAPLTLYEHERYPMFYHELLGYLRDKGRLDRMEVEMDNDDLISVSGGKELSDLLYALPTEAKGGLGKGKYMIQLSPKPATVMQSIADARKKSGDWAQFQLLYDAHPLAHYWLTKMQTQIERGTAPVAYLGELQDNTATFVFYGQATNELGQSLMSDFIAVTLSGNGEAMRAGPLSKFLEETTIRERPPVRTTPAPVLRKLEGLISDAVEWGKVFYLDSRLAKLKGNMDTKQEEYNKDLERWLGSSLEIRTAPAPTAGEKPSDAYKLRRTYERGKERYDKFTKLQSETHLQLLAVYHCID